MGYDFKRAFNRPVKIVNDAAMQALGSYRRGKMLFLGLGTGLGSAMIANGIVEPMELGHLPYKKGTYEDYVGARGLKKRGKKKWRRSVADVVSRLVAALGPHRRRQQPQLLVEVDGANRLAGPAGQLPDLEERETIDGDDAHIRTLTQT